MMDVALSLFKTNPETDEDEQDGKAIYYRDDVIGTSALSRAQSYGERWMTRAPDHTYRIDRLNF